MAGQLIIICGVSGSGKSTIAKRLSERMHAIFLDADDFHSTTSVERMRQGIPLDEELRAPWIAAIRAAVLNQPLGRDCVLAFPGLRRVHRDALRRLRPDTQFFFLHLDRDEINKRLTQRAGHFMPGSLLDSQFELLERPAGEPDVILIEETAPLDQTVSHIEQELAREKQKTIKRKMNKSARP